MKTEQQIREARSMVVRELITARLNPETQQYALLAGMSAALQWVCGEGDTLQRLIDGEKVQHERTE